VSLWIRIDGVQSDPQRATVAVRDRAFQYGDGLFETMRLEGGAIRYRQDHLERLARGCDRLGIALPNAAALARDLDDAATECRDGVVKLIVSRGDGERGYRPERSAVPRRVVTVYDAAAAPTGVPIVARWCATRLARNPCLAGIKHLNRLEQVLAQAEWQDPRIAEGLMLDVEGEVICGTCSNVFAVVGGTLCTPDLRFAGVAGVMRRRVLAAADERGVAVAEISMRPADIESASELFVTNALTGIRPIGQLGDRYWTGAPIATQLAHDLGLW